MSCAMVDPNPDAINQSHQPVNGLVGTLVSSLHKLKDHSNVDGGFFVFGDLSAKVEGRYRLLFTLYEMKDGLCMQRSTVLSAVFRVYPMKTFPGMSESTFLTRSFSDQGVRLRLRKESRTLATKKRNNSTQQRVENLYGRTQTGRSVRQRTSYEQNPVHGGGAPISTPASISYRSSSTGSNNAWGNSVGQNMESPISQSGVADWQGQSYYKDESSIWGGAS